MGENDEFMRKQPRQNRSRALVDALLQATDEFLARTGDAESLSLHDVARRAGVGIGSLYDYFANRDSLVGALLQKITRVNFDALERSVAQSYQLPFDKALPHLFEAVLATYLEHPRRTRAVVLAIGKLGWMTPVVRERDRFAHVVVERLRAEHPDVPEADARVVAEVLCDCAMGFVDGARRRLGCLPVRCAWVGPCLWEGKTRQWVCARARASQVPGKSCLESISCMGHGAVFSHGGGLGANLYDCGWGWQNNPGLPTLSWAARTQGRPCLGGRRQERRKRHEQCKPGSKHPDGVGAVRGV